MLRCERCDEDHPAGSPDCPASRVGRTVDGRFEVVKLIGMGGMGVVYEARRAKDGRVVALKMLLAKGCRNHKVVARFTREASALGRLSHPAIVQVLASGADENEGPYFAMELLRGMPLDAVLERGPLPIGAAVELACAVLDGLAAMHAASVCHRDIKPDNLFIAQDESGGVRVKIIDFGIAMPAGEDVAKVTQTGTTVGTVTHMSPEQARGLRDVDARSDLYSLGATLFQMLTAHPPVRGETWVDIALRVTTGDIDRRPSVHRAEVPPWLDEVVAKALALDPAERFQTAVEMRAALEAGAAAAGMGITPGGDDGSRGAESAPAARAAGLESYPELRLDAPPPSAVSADAPRASSPGDGPTRAERTPLRERPSVRPYTMSGAPSEPPAAAPPERPSEPPPRPSRPSRAPEPSAGRRLLLAVLVLALGVGGAAAAVRMGWLDPSPPCGPLPHAAARGTRDAHGRCALACDQGYADCDGREDNGCEADTRADPAHCGACRACAYPHGVARCEAGRCALASCAEGFADCDDDAANGCETDTRGDPRHCGRCDRACRGRPHAPAGCDAGACTSECAEGYGDCDRNRANGCETSLLASAQHCGACGRACALEGGSGACRDGGCVVSQCRAPLGDCDGDPATGCETDTSRSADHCGACGARCEVEHGDARCEGGRCAVARCHEGFADCDNDPANGCEVELAADVDHCGACAVACERAHGAPACAAGRCALRCEPGFADCNPGAGDGCETDTRASVAHCGACGQACGGAHATAACSAGACALACEAGWGDCDRDAANGCETDTRASGEHCGACGQACAPPRTCAAGVCHEPVAAAHELDAGGIDAGLPAAVGARDASARDAGARDAGARDASARDTGVRDAGAARRPALPPPRPGGRGR